MIGSALIALTLFSAGIPPVSHATLAVDPSRPVHLGFTLRLTHVAEMQALQLAQQNPTSPSFRQWLTPEAFGARFGQPEQLVNRSVQWLKAAGFQVSAYPNRSFLEAIGTVSQTKKLLAIDLKGFPDQPASVHVPDRAPTLPSWLAAQVVHVTGLDTRGRAHRHSWDSYGDETLGPQDLRRLYDATALQLEGFYGQGQQLVYIGAAEALGNGAQTAGIQWFYSNVSDSSTTFIQRVLANPDDDFDTTEGGFGEDDLDAEMQSVGSPAATSITFDEVPYSQLIVLGAQDVANNLPNVTAVSLSWGDCEPDELSSPVPGYGFDEPTATRQAVIQGTMEGQTWFVAAGDDGADDCETGVGPTVDFPGTIPEVTDVGGTGIYSPNLGFDADSAVTAYEQEYVWNDDEFMGGQSGGAGGGGISIIFTAADGGIPPYQTSFGYSGRAVPDIAMIAGNPYVISVDAAGVFGSGAGTSYAAPLSAGFMGLIASRMGCRLGNINAALYALGTQKSAALHDVTVGNNDLDGVTGYSAGPGFDLASGWGSLDVSQLAAAFPPCSGGVTGTPGAAYSQCSFIGCATAQCSTIPEGPSSCSIATCTADGGVGGCTLGNICNSGGPYAGNGDAGVCIPGCVSNADCVTTPDAGACDLCYNVCVSPGNATAQIGSPCSTYLDCGPGMTCLAYSQDFGDAGYCSEDCFPGYPTCSCPAGATCALFNTSTTCLLSCSTNADCTQPGQVCQPTTVEDNQGNQSTASTCLPTCDVFPDAGVDGGPFDTCLNLAPAGYYCVVDSGVCNLSPTSGSIGSTGTIGTTGTGSTTAGTPTGTTGGTSGSSTTGGTGTTGRSIGSATTTSTASGSGTTSGGATTSTGTASSPASGCGCTAGGSGSPDLILGAALLGLCLRRRRRA